MKSKPLQVLFDAMHYGKYSFDEFLHSDITSNYSSYTADGRKQRKVYRPDKKLKTYLSFLNTFVFEHLEVNERVVYSYRRGVNPHQVAAAHARGRAFFQTDFEDFFGSIRRTLIATTLHSQRDRVPTSDLHLHVERILELTTINGMLPIGFPTSPTISNVCLTRFDNELESYCRSYDLVYTRYADDIVISGPCRQVLDGVELKLDALLAYHFSGNLRLNSAKRKLTTVGRKTRIMGMVILPNGRVTIDKMLKKRIEVLLYFYIRNRETFLNMSDGDRKAGIQKLSGYINYINSADKPYLEKLRRKFGITVIDSFLHRSAQ